MPQQPRLEMDQHPIANIINQALLHVPEKIVGGKSFTDILGSMKDNRFQQFVGAQLKISYIDDAKALHRIDATVAGAQREAERIDDKVHQQAHFWLTVLPTDGQLFISWQDAMDFTAWYFGVFLREQSSNGFHYCRHAKAIPRKKPKEKSSNRKGQVCCGHGYKHNDNHLFGCQHCPKTVPHNRLRDRLAVCLSSTGLPVEREARAPEFGVLNGKDVASSLDIKIQNFGESPDPAFIDVSIRELRSMRADSTNTSKKDPLVAGDEHKQKTYPLVSKGGHLNVKGQLFPVVFSPWGGLSPQGTKFFQFLAEKIGVSASLRIRKVMSVEFVRTIAYKLRHGAGFPHHHPDKDASPSDIQASARGFPPSQEGVTFSHLPESGGDPFSPALSDEGGHLGQYDEVLTS